MTENNIDQLKKKLIEDINSIEQNKMVKQKVMYNKIYIESPYDKRVRKLADEIEHENRRLERELIKKLEEENEKLAQEAMEKIKRDQEEWIKELRNKNKT